MKRQHTQSQRRAEKAQRRVARSSNRSVGRLVTVWTRDPRIGGKPYSAEHRRAGYHSHRCWGCRIRFACAVPHRCLASECLGPLTCPKHMPFTIRHLCSYCGVARRQAFDAMRLACQEPAASTTQFGGESTRSSPRSAS